MNLVDDLIYDNDYVVIHLLLNEHLIIKTYKDVKIHDLVQNKGVQKLNVDDNVIDIVLEIIETLVDFIIVFKIIYVVVLDIGLEGGNGKGINAVDYVVHFDQDFLDNYFNIDLVVWDVDINYENVKKSIK